MLRQIFLINCFCSWLWVFSFNFKLQFIYFGVQLGSVTPMEVTDATTDSSFTYNATSSDLLPGDNIAIWLPLIIIIVSAILILGLIVAVRSFFCGEKPLQQSIVGSYDC
jgi:hypothetical protein